MRDAGQIDHPPVGGHGGGPAADLGGGNGARADDHPRSMASKWPEGAPGGTARSAGRSAGISTTSVPSRPGRQERMAHFFEHDVQGSRIVRTSDYERKASRWRGATHPGEASREMQRMRLLKRARRDRRRARPGAVDVALQGAQGAVRRGARGERKFIKDNELASSTPPTAARASTPAPPRHDPLLRRAARQQARTVLLDRVRSHGQHDHARVLRRT